MTLENKKPQVYDAKLEKPKWSACIFVCISVNMVKKMNKEGDKTIICIVLGGFEFGKTIREIVLPSKTR